LDNIHRKIAPSIIGRDVFDQRGLDRILIELDGTPTKSALGANAILGVSLACAHAAANSLEQPLFRYLGRLYSQSGVASPPLDRTAPDSALESGIPVPLLPVPMVNMISGGLHAGGNLDFQDFLIIPRGARTYSEALHWVALVYRSLQRVLRSHGLESVLVGDEGGFGPRAASNQAAMEFVVESIDAAGFKPGAQIGIAIDVASSHFYDGDHYRLAATAKKSFTAAEFVDELAGWVDRYPIISIEDGCAEDDWDGWNILTERLGGRVQLIGDDLFVTHPDRLVRGISSRVANAILVKPNQIGTLTETLQVIALAQSVGYRTIISARSGETEDTTIAHLAVGSAAGQIKIGSIARSERLAKYNELLRIEEELGEGAAYAADIFAGFPARQIRA
jgi:enolase